MSASKLRRGVAALAFVSTFILLPPVGALPRTPTPRVAGPAQRWDDVGTFGSALWHVLTALWGGSGAKIDGNG